MTTTIDDIAAKLAGDILEADGPAAVSACVDATLNKLLREPSATGPIENFIDRMVFLLGEYDPIYRTVEQWSNIKTARMHLHRFRRNLPSSTHVHS